MHHVEILAASSCAHCRQLTDVLTDACVGADCEVHAVDLAQHPEAGPQRAGLMHSPIVMVDGRVLPSSWAVSAHTGRGAPGASLTGNARILRELKRQIRS